MPAVSDATKAVGFLFWPVGFRGSGKKKITHDEIKNWVKNENPSFIQCLPNISIGGGGATLVGAVLGLVGIKKDSRFCKWIGAILVLAGLAASGFGVFLAKLMADASEASKKSKKPLEITIEENFLNELKEITKVDKSKRPTLRKALLKKYIEHEEEIKNILQRYYNNRESNEDKALASEARECNEILLDIKTVGELIPILKDKTKDIEARCKAASDIGDLSTLADPEQIQILVDCIKDKSDDPSVRGNAIYSLCEQSIVEHSNGKSAINLFVSCLEDKSENFGVRVSAADALGDVGDESVIESLKRIYHEEDKKVSGEKNYDDSLFNAAIGALRKIKERIPDISRKSKD